MGLAEDEDNDVLEGVDDAEAVAVDEAVPVLVDVDEGVVVLLPASSVDIRLDLYQKSANLRMPASTSTMKKSLAVSATRA